MASSFQQTELPTHVFGLSESQWTRFCKMAEKTTNFTVLHHKWNFNEIQSYSGPIIICDCQNFVSLKKEFARFGDINEDFFKFVVTETFQKVLFIYDSLKLIGTSILILKENYRGSFFRSKKE